VAQSKCPKCNGTGKIYLHSIDRDPNTTTTCSKCGGSGKKYRPK
jgi:DnaJ-class molecular chaperone